MMNKARVTSKSLRRVGATVSVGLIVASSVLVLGTVAKAAEPVYPFEGSWVVANRACTAGSPHVRIYTPHEVTSRGGRCSFKKVASGSGLFEIFEDCHHSERPGDYTETIRMIGPDAMQMKRQAGRLKIARGARYYRCSIAGPASKAPSAPPPRKPATSVPETQTHIDEPPKPSPELVTSRRVKATLRWYHSVS